MTQLAQSVPGLKQIFDCNPVNQQGCPTGQGVTRTSGATNFNSLGDVISVFSDLAFTLAFFLVFFWMVWGAFQYIFAGGDKASLEKARSRMTWAIIGFFVLALAFAIAQFAQQILQPRQATPISFEIVQTVYAQGVNRQSKVDLGNQYDFGGIQTLGQGINLLITPAFSIASLAVIIYLIMGAFKYLTSAGNKEATGKARQMITHSIVGFVILMMLFIVLQFIPQYFGFRLSLF